MNDLSPIIVEPMTNEDLSEVVALIIAQMTRLYALDPRLEPAHTPERVVASLTAQRERISDALIARNRVGRVRGYVQPSLFRIAPGSEYLSFFTARTGTLQRLVLPAPEDDDSHTVITLFLQALDEIWQQYNTTSDVCMWPSCDRWVEQHLMQAGFLLDNAFAYHPPTPLEFSKQPVPTTIGTRLAHPSDEDALVALYLEELTFHLPYTPFARMVPELEPAFRRQLSLIWNEEGIESGAPLVLVAEDADKVVAFAETYLETVVEEDLPTRLPPGRYCYICNVGVHTSMRGKGVGRLLVQKISDVFSEQSLSGYFLWFTITNPLSSLFWPRLGFFPLWTTYQRLH